MIVKNTHIVEVIKIKINKMLIIFSILLVFSLSCSMVSATDNNDTSIQLDDNNQDMSSLDNNDIGIETSKNDDVLQDSSSNSNTVTIVVDKENPNQVLNPTIQPAIDAANPGDTIILEGDFVHCHFLINKTINIIATDSTLGPCPHHQTEGSGNFGVFYITEGGSGSVIEGVTFKNNARAVTPFSFLIRGASNVTIRDCTVDYPEANDYKYQGIVIENSDNINIKNISINDTIFGIRIINSSNVSVEDCIIQNGIIQAISVSGDSYNINIFNNSILNNAMSGINLTSANNITILNNLIKNNGLKNDDSGSGIYVNTNITKLIVKGNIFIGNALHAIMYDYRARNLDNEDGADQLAIVDNNYFEGHSSMVLHHRIYVERDYGTLKYDAENDVYGDVGEGSYAEGKSYVYMRNAFIYKDVPCGFTYYSTTIPWSLEAPANDGKYNFSLKLSKISQVKKGAYQIAIVDDKGNVAEDFNNFEIIFFLNNYTAMTPQENDVYKKAIIKNGVAEADFSEMYDSYKSTGNVITAVFPGASDSVGENPHESLDIADTDIPINPVTKLTASKLTTYPLSDSYFSAKLVDRNGNAIANQKITFKFNGKTYAEKTDSRGVAKVKVSVSSKKTYSVTVNYAGNDDYSSSKATSSIVVKTGSAKSKIKASNMKIKKNKKKTFKLTLTSSAGKALKNQKVTVKLNGKSYILKTNSKGVAKLSIKLKKVKKYSLSMKFLGNANYKAVSKTIKITVTK